MRNFINKARDTVMSNVPSELAPDNQYAKAVAAALAIGVTHRRKFEEIDFNGVTIFLGKDKFLKKEQLVSRAMGFFRIYVKELQVAASVDDLEFATAQSNIIEIANACPKAHYAKFKDTLYTLKQASDAKTVDILNRMDPWN